MNQTVLITGASSGFGEACAWMFASEGWRLVLAARRIDRLRELAQTLGPAECHIIELDIRNRNAVAEKLGQLPQPYRDIDVLINNAGLALGLETSDKTDLDDWDRMVDTNIKGLLYVTRAVLPGMVTRNRGYIINLGSTAGSWPYRGGNVYGGTKAFVEQFSRNLRTDLQGSAVRVTNLEPGLSETEFSLVRFKGDKEASAKMYSGVKALQPEDIAEVCRWLVNLPPHVNVNRMEVMPLCQSWERLRVERP